MKKQLPAWAALCIIALIAGLMLGATNELTVDRILEQTLAAADAARQEVLPMATTFVQQELPEGALVDNCYMGLDGDTIVGYTAQMTVKGYGGNIEVIAGLDMEGTLTGIHVGGAEFSETAGLGAKTKSPAFTEQFRGITPPAVNRENVDAVTAATISSGAVISGVNRCAEFMRSLIVGEEEAPEEGYSSAFTNLVEQPAADGIDAWWKADEGYVIKASGKGFGGQVTAAVSIFSDGSIASVVFEAPNETPGLGERITTDESFIEQFTGKSTVDGVDVLSGATISSTAAIEAVQKALDFAGGL